MTAQAERKAALAVRVEEKVEAVAEPRKAQVGWNKWRFQVEFAAVVVTGLAVEMALTVEGVVEIQVVAMAV